MSTNAPAPDEARQGLSLRSRTARLGPSIGRGSRRLTTRRHQEEHAGHRATWLRAAILGANDGLLSTSSLLVGVASASADSTVLLATGVAALVAGAGSMAIGEYSSVSSQRDAERADLAIEAEELREIPSAELDELAAIYRGRGLSKELAREVAEALTEHDALTAHARDELGIDPGALSNPLEAAVVSAASFAVGALLPIFFVLVAGASIRVPVLVGTTLIGLGVLGAVGARLGGAPPLRPAVRVLLGGGAAMAIAWLVGQLFNVSVA
ncbi:VIT1/CCC1 transporter family protein [Aquihabitans sp. McL0605]|uniref:VIT1/CCC1 transporter family protein n=1 Tax=Aquihabitans sp. McL0605 TaxID=3415671 RepID=UPI003CED84DF